MTGLGTAHCSRCHGSFGGTVAFDRHQAGGRCASTPVELAAIGLREVRTGVWGREYPQRSNEAQSLDAQVATGNQGDGQAA